MSFRTLPTLLAALCTFAAGATAAQAQAFPSKPITLVVPFPAGGALDAVARPMAEGMRKILGQAVVVENVPGAVGTVGTGNVARAAPDGYTILLGSVATHAIAAGIYPKLSYDPLAGFAPITQLTRGPLVLAAAPQLKAASVRELVAAAKASPGTINHSSTGNGTALHVAGELFKSAAGSVAFIPFEQRDPWSQRYALTIRADEHDISEESIRTACHAYYAMTSYFDSLVGRLLDVLERIGQTEETVVFVIADHGEMMGERGSWFKFQPFEWSVRVPMIASGPGVQRGRREERAVSLLDLKNDPDELVNLAGVSAHAALERAMHAEVHTRWDYAGIERDVLESQRSRLFAREALLQGRWTAWDFQPVNDASRQFVRGAVDPNTTATKAKRRFPFVPAVPPDRPRQS